MTVATGLSGVETIIEICKKHRISRFKTAEYEFELELPPSPDQIAAQQEFDTIKSKMKPVTDDEILMNPYAGMEGLNYANNEHT